MEELKEAGKHAKPYEILGPLGKGKFAMVYKAQLGHDLYALKKVAVSAARLRPLPLPAHSRLLWPATMQPMR